MAESKETVSEQDRSSTSLDDVMSLLLQMRADHNDLKQRVLTMAETISPPRNIHSSETRDIEGRQLFSSEETPQRDPSMNNNMPDTFNVNAAPVNGRRSSGYFVPLPHQPTPPTQPQAIPAEQMLSPPPASVSFTPVTWNYILRSSDCLDVYKFSLERETFVQLHMVAATRGGLPGLWSNLDRTIQEELNVEFPNVKTQAGNVQIAGASGYGWAYMSDRFMLHHLYKLHPARSTAEFFKRMMDFYDQWPFDYKFTLDPHTLNYVPLHRETMRVLGNVRKFWQDQVDASGMQFVPTPMYKYIDGKQKWTMNDLLLERMLPYTGAVFRDSLGENTAKTCLFPEFIALLQKESHAYLHSLSKPRSGTESILRQQALLNGKTSGSSTLHTPAKATTPAKQSITSNSKPDFFARLRKYRERKAALNQQLHSLQDTQEEEFTEEELSSDMLLQQAIEYLMPDLPAEQTNQSTSVEVVSSKGAVNAIGGGSSYPKTSQIPRLNRPQTQEEK